MFGVLFRWIRGKLGAMRFATVLSVVLAVVGCNGSGAATARDAGTDADGATGDASPLEDAGDDLPDTGPAPPPWPIAGLLSTEIPAPRGMRVARAIIHAHSVYSHDACDNMPQIDAHPNEPCLEDFRVQTCAANVDVVMLSEHGHLLGDAPFDEVVALRSGDEPIEDEHGNLVAKRLVCPDGRRVYVGIGGETDLMPVGLVRHAFDDPPGDALAGRYGAADTATVAAFRSAGALVLVAHSEQHEVAQIRDLGLDGMEIYNLHANIAPDIREEYLGLDPYGFVADLLSFNNRGTSLEPDLAFLTFLEESAVALRRWDTLLAGGMHLVGTAGTDCHENAFPLQMSDGERGDSYRRMMRWFGNYLLLPRDAAIDHDSVLAALSARRSYVAFDGLGTPVGFDFFAQASGGSPVEIGGTAASGATITLVRPSLSLGGIEAELAAPRITMRILRAEDGGATEVASGDGERLSFVATDPGAYRAEVHIVPEHARRYLGRLADRLVHEYPWVYSNPIWIE